MMSAKRSTVSLLSAICVVIALPMLSAATAAADVPVIGSGVLYLDLGTNNQFRYGTATQAIGSGSGSSCVLTPSTGDLVTISTQGGTPGFNRKKEWLGVLETSQGVDCGRVSAPSQTFTIALSQAPTSKLKDRIVQQTTLKINAKKNAVIRADLYLQGAATGRAFYFRSGLSADGTPDVDESQCNAGISDSNPDSIAQCSWQFPKGTEAPAQWDSVKLTAQTGEFGLGGPNSVSEFRLAILAQGVLGCDETNRQLPETTGPNGLVLNGTRLQNVADPLTPPGIPVCVVVPYVVSGTCPGVTSGACTNFIYDPLDQGTHMAFHFTWEWPIEAIPTGGIDAIPETLQFFINGNAIGAELDFCAHTIAEYDVDGEFVRLAPDPAYTGPLPHPQDQDSVAPGTQAGCLIHRDVNQDGATLKLVEDAWVQGDYAARRN